MFDDLFEFEKEELVESYEASEELWDTEQIWYSQTPDNVWAVD